MRMQRHRHTTSLEDLYASEYLFGIALVGASRRLQKGTFTSAFGAVGGRGRYGPSSPGVRVRLRDRYGTATLAVPMLLGLPLIVKIGMPALHRPRR
jgi:hypothetical protein